MPVPSLFGVIGGGAQTSAIALLLHGDGANGGQNNTFLDSSSSALAVTRAGTVTQGTVSPYATGGASGFFPGVNTDYLTLPNNIGQRFGSGDFTIECWVYPLAFAAEQTLLSRWNAATVVGTNQWLFWASSGTPRLAVSTDGAFSAAEALGPAMTLDQWNHVAAVRNGTSLTVYTNGVPGTPVSIAGSLYASETELLGVSWRRNAGAFNGPFNGFLGDARIVKGTAVYTAAFTPPTEPLTAISGTTLLMLFDNGQVLDSARKADLRTVGTAQISTAQSKFGGSSIRLAAAGDALALRPPPDLAFGTQDFTLETFIRLDSVAGSSVIYDQRPTAASGAYPTISRSGTALTYQANGLTPISGGTLSAGTWHHVAVCRVGGVTRMFLDGVQVGASWSDTTSYVVGSTMFLGNSAALSTASVGYLEELRALSGVGIYASNFTPPTAPFPNN